MKLEMLCDCIWSLSLDCYLIKYSIRELSEVCLKRILTKRKKGEKKESKRELDNDVTHLEEEREINGKRIFSTQRCLINRVSFRIQDW